MSTSSGGGKEIGLRSAKSGRFHRRDSTVAPGPSLRLEGIVPAQERGQETSLCYSATVAELFA